MKRMGVRTVEDFEAMPENEWVEAMGPLKFRWVNDKVRVKGDTLVVPLPESVRKKFRPKEGQVLRARVAKDTIVIEPANRARRKRHART